MTAVSADIRGNYRRYTQTMGMRLVKRSVNQDDVSTIEKLLQDFRKSRHNLESVSSDELLERIEQGKALDVSLGEEYEAGHIVSVHSLPQNELAEKLKSLPKNKEIIAYCRGPLCAMADDAIKLLNEYGYRAARSRRSDYSGQENRKRLFVLYHCFDR